MTRRFLQGGFNVKPTRVHYFFAQNWLARIWVVAIPSLSVLLMARGLGPAPEFAGFEAEAKNYLFLLGIALLLGLCVAALVGPFILGPIYHYRAELNGAPFQTGDRVEVLVGANSGRVARVAEVWEGRAHLRVDWDPAVARKSKTVFHFAQVIKVGDAAGAKEPSRPLGAA